ncbi:MAG: hypothetical protein K2K29_02905, partial [Muribaculaceae bacterium]|nr:hypothetical protein [Muribaculaceae bacterium]
MSNIDNDYTTPEEGPDFETGITEESEGQDEIAEPLFITGDGREMYEHFRFVADSGQKLLRVDKFLVERMQKTSRNRIQQAAEADCIIVNGKPVKSSYRVK